MHTCSRKHSLYLLWTRVFSFEGIYFSYKDISKLKRIILVNSQCNIGGSCFIVSKCCLGGWPQEIELNCPEAGETTSEQVFRWLRAQSCRAGFRSQYLDVGAHDTCTVICKCLRSSTGTHTHPHVHVRIHSHRHKHTYTYSVSPSDAQTDTNKNNMCRRKL